MQVRGLLVGAVVLGLVFVLIVLACSPQGDGGAATPGPTLPPERLLESRCGGCHGLDRVQAARKTQAEWEQVVRRMRSKGARLSDEEAALLVSYLAATYK